MRPTTIIGSRGRRRTSGRNHWPAAMSDRVGPRAARRSGPGESGAGLAASPFRVDRDRIAASPFFARLAGVTRVVSPAGTGLLVHNRLTHSLAVAQVARAVAERVAGAVVGALGGCDPDAVEAAALAHDLGHPPFGHLGEQVLDRVAREVLGLPDGFEGNAQSFRIVTTIDLHGPGGTGLDLTAAVRAAVLKYPWCRRGHPDPHPSDAEVPPRGGGPLPGAPDAGSAKFSCYATELDDLVECRSTFPVGVWQQTVEAAVMDTADDIAYAIHDLEAMSTRFWPPRRGPAAGRLRGRADGLAPQPRHGRSGCAPGGAAAAARQGRLGVRRRRVHRGRRPRPRRAGRRPARDGVRRLDGRRARRRGVLRPLDGAAGRRGGGGPGTRRCDRGRWRWSRRSGTRWRC